MSCGKNIFNKSTAQHKPQQMVEVAIILDCSNSPLGHLLAQLMHKPCSDNVDANDNSHMIISGKHLEPSL